MFESAGARWQGIPPLDYGQLARDMAFTPRQVPPATGRLVRGSCPVAAVQAKWSCRSRESPDSGCSEGAPWETPQGGESEEAELDPRSLMQLASVNPASRQAAAMAELDAGVRFGVQPPILSNLQQGE